MVACRLKWPCHVWRAMLEFVNVSVLACAHGCPVVSVSDARRMVLKSYCWHCVLGDWDGSVVAGGKQTEFVTGRFFLDPC